MSKQLKMTTIRKSLRNSAKSFCFLKTARANIAARRFLRNFSGSSFNRIDRQSELAFRKLSQELHNASQHYEEKLREKKPVLSLANFPGPPEIYDVSELGEFHKRVFGILMDYDKAIVFLESAWLHQAIPSSEHNRTISSLEGRIYETVSRLGKHCSNQSALRLARQSIRGAN